LFCKINKGNRIIKKFNLLYCHDEGYNLQTFLSINSVLKNSETSIFDIHILHENPDTFSSYCEKLKTSPKINEIFLYKFKDINNFFPNIKGKHVSAATYYRLFIQNYLPDSLNSLIYLDSDVIAIKNVDKIFEKCEREILESKFTIYVSTEMVKLNENHDVFKNLELVGTNYFNAGVMFIDYKKWKNKTSINKFLDLIELYKEKIIFWDQDVLNKFFDNNFLKLSDNLNFRVYEPVDYTRLDSDAVLLHYSGNAKPWTIQGGYKRSSQFFLDNYREHYPDKFYFELNKSRLESTKLLIKLLLNNDFLSIEYKFTYFIKALEIILSGKNKQDVF
tara:strand:+ start:784 stop:1782 length:999 start_codon:yes stop_codon:yes gene_type:complete